MGLMTCHITTTDPDQLHDALHLLQSFANGDRRPLTLEYRLTGIDIHIGDPQPDNEDEPGLLDRIDDWITLDEGQVIELAHAIAAEHPADEPQVEVTTFAKPAPESDPDGTETCPGCDQPYRTRRAVSDHIRIAHWDDVINTYSDLGAQGLQTDWGVSQGTAYRWAADIRGDNAA